MKVEEAVETTLSDALEKKINHSLSSLADTLNDLDETEQSFFIKYLFNFICYTSDAQEGICILLSSTDDNTYVSILASLDKHNAESAGATMLRALPQFIQSILGIPVTKH